MRRLFCCFFFLTILHFFKIDNLLSLNTKRNRKRERKLLIIPRKKNKSNKNDLKIEMNPVVDQ